MATPRERKKPTKHIWIKDHRGRNRQKNYKLNIFYENLIRFLCSKPMREKLLFVSLEGKTLHTHNTELFTFTYDSPE